MNTKLLRKVRNQILKEPKRFDMARFVNRCGTAACICGWAVAIHEKQTRALRAVRLDGLVCFKAAEYLGIRQANLAPLFVAGLWPEPFATQYCHANTPKQKARIAADRINHMLKTGQ